MAPSKYEYALIRALITEDPKLEKNITALAAAYRVERPGLKVSDQGLRSVLLAHGIEVLGRPFQPGRNGDRAVHDHGLIAQLLADDPSLAGKPAEAVRIYTEKTAKVMHVKHMAKVLRRLTEEQSTEEVPGSTDAAVDRFAEMLRIYSEVAPTGGDVLHGGTTLAHYAGWIADSIHWARRLGISPEKAFIAAWESVGLEKV